jgi:hypothetical protein
MEWSMLLVAGALAATAVAAVHTLRRHAHATAKTAGGDRRIVAAGAVRAVEDDVEAARTIAETLSLEQRPRV